MKNLWNRIREAAPLIHGITNYVTINDVANVLLACGASPIMAEAPQEAAEICAGCDGLLLNLGMPRPDKLEAMILAGREANRLKIPVVLDPVGVGASVYRMDSVSRLLREVSFSVIRGNLSEIQTLCRNTSSRGVDACREEGTTEDALLGLAKELAHQTRAIIALTGPTDVITDGDRTYSVYNGCPMLSKITGSGCMLSALTAACVAASPQDPLMATVTAVTAMGVCGETAANRMTEQDGNGSFRVYLLDAVFRLTGDELEVKARYET